MKVGAVLEMFVFRIQQDSGRVKAQKHTAVVVDVESKVITICTDKFRERSIPPTVFLPEHELFKPRSWSNEEETLSFILCHPGNMTWKQAFPMLKKSLKKAVRERARKVKDETYMNLKIIDNSEFA